MGSRPLALWLAFGVPFVAYVLTSGAHSYWLDSGEFVAAAVRLDIAHPPGHPLTELYSSLWTLLPLGSLAWRVAIGQAFAAALAALFACVTIRDALCRLELEERVVWPLAVAGAWSSALAYGIWFQAVRPEVYALQTLCMSIVMQRITRMEAARALGVMDTRPLYSAAFALGLGLANHHLIAFLVAPALLPSVIGSVRARGVRPLLIACGFGALALCTYAYLPVRALASPAVNLGDPSNWHNFMWVLSARVYSKNLVFQSVGSAQERGIDMLILLLESFHPFVLLAALVGVYLALRTAATRRHAFFFLLVLGIDAGVRTWMGSLLGNPDVLGYLGPALLTLGVLFALCVGLLVWLLQAHWPRASSAISACVLALPLLVAFGARDAYARASLSRFAATDVFDEQRVRTLPPRAVVIASTAQTAFCHWELESVEAVRPDVTMVPVSFLRYPGTAELFVQRSPDIARWVSAYLAHDLVPRAESVALAQQRPVYVELEAHTPTPMYEVLRPSHLLHEVLAQPGMLPSTAEAARAQTRMFTTLYAQLGTDVREVETSRQLLWIHFMDAIYFAALGGRDLARAEVARAQALHPHDTSVAALAAALSAPNVQGPLAVDDLLRVDLSGH